MLPSELTMFACVLGGCPATAATLLCNRSCWYSPLLSHVKHVHSCSCKHAMLDICPVVRHHYDTDPDSCLLEPAPAPQYPALHVSANLWLQWGVCVASAVRVQAQQYIVKVFVVFIYHFNVAGFQCTPQGTCQATRCNLHTSAFRACSYLLFTFIARMVTRPQSADQCHGKSILSQQLWPL